MREEWWLVILFPLAGLAAYLFWRWDMTRMDAHFDRMHEDLEKFKQQ